jgi:hypothetical protein
MCLKTENKEKHIHTITISQTFYGSIIPFTITVVLHSSGTFVSGKNGDFTEKL